jgi:hypothetical protein
MKKFQISYNYYKELIWTEIIDSNKLTIAYIYTLPNQKEKFNYEEINKTIDSFKLNSSDNFFYKTSIKCISDKKLCQNDFKKYIDDWKWSENKNIQLIKKAFSDYKTFTNYKSLEEKKQYFKDTYILSALFKAKLYTITNILWKDILKEKPNYLTVLKIIAKWYFDLWKYKDAKIYLLESNKIDKTNSKIHYMIGIVNIKLHDYILSNIYFNKALKYWFENKSDISRRLIYNYYLIWSNDKIISEFEILINSWENLSTTDYSLGIYYSIINWKNNLANKWTNKALDLFPKDDNFYWYKWWILKDEKDYETSEQYLKKWFELNNHNPLINLNLWIIEANRWELLKAKIYFKNTILEDSNWDFWKFATKKLEEILLEEEKFEREIEENY